MEKENKIIEMYLDYSNTIKDIQDQCNCSEFTMYKILKDNNIPLRGKGRKKIIKNPFISFSPEACYWLGYLFADGHILNNGKGHYTLSLFSTSMDILEKYNKFLDNKGAIYKANNNGTYGVYLCSKDIIMWFVDTLKVQSPKAFTLNPNITLNWDYIRGYFDGDGCIRLSDNSKRECQFTTASEVWANRISKFLSSYNIKNSVRYTETDLTRFYNVMVYGKIGCTKLYYYMYKNASTYLDYKFKRFEQLYGNIEEIKEEELLETLEEGNQQPSLRKHI